MDDDLRRRLIAEYLKERPNLVRNSEIIIEIAKHHGLSSSSVRGVLVGSGDYVSPNKKQWISEEDKAILQERYFNTLARCQEHWRREVATEAGIQFAVLNEFFDNIEVEGPPQQSTEQIVGGFHHAGGYDGRIIRTDPVVFGVGVAFVLIPIVVVLLLVVLMSGAFSPYKSRTQRTAEALCDELRDCHR